MNEFFMYVCHRERKRGNISAKSDSLAASSKLCLRFVLRFIFPFACFRIIIQDIPRNQLFSGKQ